MKKSRLIPSLIAVCSTLFPMSVFAVKNSVAEFDRKESEDLGWRVVDDGVMGGLSKGKLQISKDGILNFSGKLSLENNGGFSSLRTEKLKMDLSAAAGLVTRVKGDGRTYQIRLGTEARYRGMEVSFMAEVATKKGKWVEVKVPFDQFTASFRGMKLKDETFNPSEVRRIGLLLGDKKPGPFNLEVDWIRTYGADEKGSDLVKTALGDGRFGILAKALTEANLVEVLQGEGPFTVFAPTDEAFGKLPKGTLENLLKSENREQLQAVLKYHVVSGSVSLADALAAKNAQTVQGEAVKIGFSSGRVRVNGAAILDADIACSNGIIHVIDAVILPPKPANDLGSVAKRAGKFGTLLAAVEAAGFSDLLASEGPLTVFAPVDAAFNALPEGTVESLLKPENREKLRRILANHVVAGKVSAGDALNSKSANAVDGGKLEFGIVDGVFRVNGATILKTDLECDNGIIHVIDAVLLPVPKNGKAKTTAADQAGPAPLDRIEAAIGQGVPIFNKGDHEKCADLYRDCIIALSKDQSVDAKIGKALRALVERSKRIKNDTDRAWLLRSGLDHVYSALAGS